MSNTISPSEKLLQGFQKFKSNKIEQAKIITRTVQDGQTPKVLIITCCDSRVDPAILFQSDPNEIFVVRNIANLVPSFQQAKKYSSVSSALEYGVVHLGVTDIVVLGHSHCGGIKALMEDNSAHHNNDSFIQPWVDMAKSAKQKVLEHSATLSDAEKIQCCEKEAVRLSVENLKTYPWIQTKIAANELNLHAWYFDLDRIEIFT
jgi:carbonic anhydrase